MPWEDDVKNSFESVWLAFAKQQVRSYHVATAVVAKSIETCWGVAPPVGRDAHQSPVRKPLNPLEFHGKRQSEPPRLPFSDVDPRR